jgi:DNA-binding PadR family transcriptional regulator
MKSSQNSRSRKETHIEFKGLLSFLILHELSAKMLAGEDLAKKIGKRKGSTLTPGTIYPALKKLKNNKLVKFVKKGRRKEYYLTDNGKKDLEVSYELFSKYFFG